MGPALSFIIQILLLFTISATEDTEIIINTDGGLIKGYLTETLDGTKYYAFEGIPYANPPIGNNRFEEPTPKENWEGVWKANKLYTCLQYYHSTDTDNYPVIGEEDCLYLNIYTPYDLRNHTNLYNVIIFIHGGAFMFNSGGTYGPKYIMDRDVVFATINYRLGPLGFLSTEDEVLPGNSGLKDQILAMQWIKRNVHKFRGNPDSITLTGMSAGGASVHLHTLSPLSRGLFHRGIAQSGCALNPWVLVEKSKEKCEKMATVLGCPSHDSREIVDCLKSKNGSELVGAVKYFQKWLYNPISPFGIVVDNDWSKTPVLPAHPLILLEQKKVADLPMIFSHVGAEGLYPGADFIREDRYLRKLDENWNELIPHILEYNNTMEPNDLIKISSLIRKHYFKNNTINNESFPTLIQLLSDRLFIFHIIKAVKLQCSAIKSPLYYYFFNYRGTHSKSEIRTGKNINFGVSHADDTVNVLYSNIDMRSNVRDKKMSEMVTDMWISFAANNLNATFPNWVEVQKSPSDYINYLHIESPENISLQSGLFNITFLLHFD